MASDIVDGNLQNLSRAAYEADGSSSEDVDMGKWVNLSSLNVDLERVHLSTDLTARVLEAFLKNEAAYEWPDLALGNSYFYYWNARAVATFKHLVFAAVNSPLHGSEILKRLPQHAPQVPPSETSHMQSLFLKLERDAEACLTCRAPAESPRSPWQLIMRTMSSETQAVVKTVHPGRNSRNSFAVVHVRCDPNILKRHADYGLLRHRFVADRLPANVQNLVVVGESISFDVKNICGKCIKDFQEYMEQRNVSVELRSNGTQEEDWHFLASAPLLFCAPSTFCASAAFGNPNQVFLAVNDNTSVRQPLFSVPSPRNLQWVQTDFLPGQWLKHQSWEDTRDYLRASSCAVSFCVPRAN